MGGFCNICLEHYGFEDRHTHLRREESQMLGALQWHRSPAFLQENMRE